MPKSSSRRLPFLPITMVISLVSLLEMTQNEHKSMELKECWLYYSLAKRHSHTHTLRKDREKHTWVWTERGGADGLQPPRVQKLIVRFWTALVFSSKIGCFIIMNFWPHTFLQRLSSCMCFIKRPCKSTLRWSAFWSGCEEMCWNKDKLLNFDSQRVEMYIWT